MEILEDEDERPPLGHRLEEQSPRCKRLAASVFAELAFFAEPHQREEIRPNPRCVGGIGDHLVYGSADLLGCLGGLVLLMDSGLGLDDLAERPQRHSVAIREAASLTPGDELGIVLGDLSQLVNETALADAGHADQRHEL